MANRYITTEEMLRFASLELHSSNMHVNKKYYFAPTLFFFVVVIVVLLATIALAVPSSVTQESACPRMVSRAEWKARKPLSMEKLPHSPAPYLVVHHGGIKKYCHEQLACSAIVRSYQNLHIDTNGWQDIGYSYLIGEDGNVYEGRGWNRVGAHAPGYNFQSIGVCFIGNFNDALPNKVALEALNSLMRCGLALGKLKKNYSVIGHRQSRKTECPGDALYKYIQRFPNWTNRPIPILSNHTETHSTT